MNDVLGVVDDGEDNEEDVCEDSVEDEVRELLVEALEEDDFDEDDDALDDVELKLGDVNTGIELSVGVAEVRMGCCALEPEE